MALLREGTPIIVIDGEALPAPARGMSFEHQQLVDSARNAKGEVVAQTINRRQSKLSDLKWLYLKRDEWERICKHIKGFQSTVQYYDPMEGGMVTRIMYWGDSKCTPLHYDDNGIPIDFINCSCNVIDMGKSDL